MQRSASKPMSSSPRRAVLALLCLLTAQFTSCTYTEGHSRVLVTSTPAGARILVDGTDSGLTTPAIIDFATTFNLGGYFGGDHDVRIEKIGFVPETRHVYHQVGYYTSRWIDGAVDTDWPIPLFWTLGDFFTPFGIRWSYVPREIHVQLYAEAEGPGESRVGSPIPEQ